MAPLNGSTFRLSVAAHKAPDAIQLATAILYGTTAFLSNDKIFERVKGVDILILDKLLKP